jgi:hypothetical protein
MEKIQISIHIEDNLTEPGKATENVDTKNNNVIGKNSIVGSEFDTDNFLAKQLDYNENYLIADLKKIAEYYDIPTRKLRKEELVQELVIFENDPENAEVYLKRLQAWFWLKELKQDPKIKQYILF